MKFNGLIGCCAIGSLLMISSLGLASGPREACEDAYATVYFRYRLPLQRRVREHARVFERVRADLSALELLTLRRGAEAATRAWTSARKWLSSSDERVRESELVRAREQFHLFKIEQESLGRIVNLFYERLGHALSIVQYPDPATSEVLDWLGHVISIEGRREPLGAEWLSASQLSALLNVERPQGLKVCSVVSSPKLYAFARDREMQGGAPELAETLELCHTVPFEAIDRADVGALFTLEAAIEEERSRALAEARARWLSPYSTEARWIALGAADAESFIEAMGRGCERIPEVEAPRR